MSLYKLAVFAAITLPSIVTGIPLKSSGIYKPTLVHQFPNFTWIENMAIRKNGEILGTDLDQGRVFLVNPFTQQANPPVLAHFENHTSVTGVSEVEDDVFYIQGINNTNVPKFEFPPNSSTVWRIDMRYYELSGRAVVSKVADIPQVELPNGMTTLSSNAILIADSYNGIIFRLDIHTGETTVAIDDPILKNIPGARPPFGVNGIKVIGNTLYFSNFNQAVVGTFPIDLSTGHATGKPHVISSKVNFVDDFAVGTDGSIWATENAAHKLVRVFPDGTVKNILGGGNSTVLNGPVAAKFGRTRKDRNVLYISTDGMTTNSQGVTLTTNGRIVSIDTEQC